MPTSERLKAFFSLGDNVNKAGSGDAELDEGVVGSLRTELSVNTPDKELLQREKEWRQNYHRYEEKLRKRQTTNEKYWKGDQDEQMLNSEATERTLVDNKIYEALETFLPQATRQNPEPVVSADNTDEGNTLSEKVRGMLLHLADTLNLRLKIKSATRNWALYYLGVIKVGWDMTENEIIYSVIRPQKLILDPNATITEGGIYTGEYIGEVKKDTASNLVQKFPDSSSHIKSVVKDKMGTQVQYTEWWADFGEIVFWTLKGEVLDKAKNPHFNYEREEQSVDENGEAITQTTQDFNHFATPQFPYSFLSVFNLGLQPHDDTNIIEQSLSQQDLVNKRQRQIDTNVDDMNGGWAISGQLSGLSKGQAAAAIQAFRKGNGVWIPEGSVQDAVERITGTSLPGDVFTQLQDARNELQGIFGVRGSTPQGVASEETVRGKIISRQLDDSRIGGGVAEYIEQFADRVYNLTVQMIAVYYDEAHIGSIIGTTNASEYIELRSADLDRKILVSVKEGSMIPKDPLTKRNEAVDLWNANAIDPITLHARLDMPNPRESAKQAFLWQTAPQQLFPEAQQEIQQAQMAAQSGAPEGGGQPEEENLLDRAPIQ